MTNAKQSQRSSPGSSTTVATGGGSVSFSPYVRIVSSMHIRNYSKEEIKSCWYTSKEMLQMLNKYYYHHCAKKSNSSEEMLKMLNNYYYHHCSRRQGTKKKRRKPKRYNHGRSVALQATPFSRRKGQKQRNNSGDQTPSQKIEMIEPPPSPVKETNKGCSTLTITDLSKIELTMLVESLDSIFI